MGLNNTMATLVETLTSALSPLKIELSSDMPVIIVEKTRLIEAIQFLVQDSECCFTFLTDLCGIHYPDQNPPVLGVVYHLHNMVKNTRIRVKAFTPVSEPVIPSLTGLFSSANWMERETYDFFGIRFEGHPELKRLLNMDDMVDFPMRKEFMLEDPTRTDKQDAYFGR